MSEKRVCSRCTDAAALANQRWCRKCFRLYAAQRRAERKAFMSMTEEEHTAQMDRVVKAGQECEQFVRLKIEAKEKGKQRRDLAPRLGKALFLLQIEVSGLREYGRWGEELKYLGLSHSQARYYIDQFHLYNLSLKKGDVPL